MASERGVSGVATMRFGRHMRVVWHSFSAPLDALEKPSRPPLEASSWQRRRAGPKAHSRSKRDACTARCSRTSGEYRRAEPRCHGSSQPKLASSGPTILALALRRRSSTACCDVRDRRLKERPSLSPTVGRFCASSARRRSVTTARSRCFRDTCVFLRLPRRCRTPPRPETETGNCIFAGGPQISTTPSGVAPRGAATKTPGSIRKNSVTAAAAAERAP
mmetsp:Transcript_25963/g.103814  ORF Transcript_25963/g.103814 Transcript_25963/m.103814 type:complete len:219 (+) Transcript_25963:370-1026(+)